MMEQNKIRNILQRLYNSPLKEDSHLYGQFQDVKIIDAVNNYHADYDSQEFQPAIIFLRVVLAANRKYNTHVKPNIDRIIETYPKLSSFQDLRHIITSMSLENFYEFWGHRNLKKYEILLDLVDATDCLRSKYNISDDFQLMHNWAQDVQIYDYKNDIIGKIKGVAIATIQHLRMDFGIDTVKPDQRVMEVLSREFGFEKINQLKAIKLVEEIAEIAGIGTRKLDSILVNYGSGYYNNRNYNTQRKLRKEIANKLNQLGVENKIILDSTGIDLENS